ncbi:MAG TPA: class A beta-lactamase [Pyrinomonadaceae bacterium]|nr:class A beta-lactamase [Pyrinomonadaceae bacterium]
MIVLNKKFMAHLCCGLTLCCVLVACGQTSSTVVEPTKAQQPPQQQQSVCSHQELQGQMEEIARVTQGPVGAGVMLVETGDVVAFNGEQRFPMQSVYKLPIAMATLRQVDVGTLKLEQKVSVQVKDFVTGRQHSPIRDKYPRGTELSVRDLLQFMVSESDGTACDVLLRVLGGPEQVTKYLHEMGVQGIAVVTLEKEMGQDEMAQYRNWVTPESMLTLLRILNEGQSLSAASKGLLLELMIQSRPGPKRIKGMLPADAVVAHKTGTSGTVNGLTRATNDVGLITLPDGRHLAVAVFVSDTKADEIVREGVIAKIARAAWDCWTKREASGK